MGRLEGKIAFITAAGQGIGRATAVAYLAEGARVHATDISARLMDELKDEHPAIETAVLDVRDSNAVRQAAARTGAVDVLFNCAGYVHAGTILDCDEEAWDRSFDINVKSMWRTAQAFLPAMLAAGGGSVINMSSCASSIKGAPNRAVYSATKAAVLGLTKSIAADFCERGIRCNAICPGTVDTPSLEERIRALAGDYQDNRSAFVARQKMGRLATVEEIAHLAVYLGSDESAFCTGGAYVIDGGWSL